MANVYSAVQQLFAYEDGDTITPGMGIAWVNGEVGLGLSQYWNPSLNGGAGGVVATSFADHPVLLYPQPFSSREGKIVVADTGSWYLNNISDDAKISASDIFEITTVVKNKATFPALKIKGELAKAADINDKTIYYVGSYDNKTFVCAQLIPVQTAVDDQYKVEIAVEGADGQGDNVISEDNDWIKLTPVLNRTGQAVTGDMTYEWQRFLSGAWKTVTNVASVTELTGSVLKLYDPAVEGVELYRCLVNYNGKEYYGVQEVRDQHDPYYIDMGSSCPSGAVQVGETVTYNPVVRERATGDVQSGWSFEYFFTDKDGNSVDGVTEKTITYENVKKNSALNVNIKASK